MSKSLNKKQPLKVGDRVVVYVKKWERHTDFTRQDMCILKVTPDPTKGVHSSELLSFEKGTVCIYDRDPWEGLMVIERIEDAVAPTRRYLRFKIVEGEKSNE